MTQFIAGFCLGIATLWTFLELLALAMRRKETPKRHLFSELNEGVDELATTRRYRDAPARTLSRELQEGMADLNRRDGVQYEWINLTGEEQ